MKHHKYIIILFILLVGLHSALGQVNVNPRTSEIFVLGKSYGDSIVVRWAPDKPAAWMLGNTYGYMIERATIGVDTLFSKAEYEQITSDTLKTWSLEKMRGFFGSDDRFAAITAQAVYGESFVPRTSNLGTEGVFDLAQEQENRYSFSLFAADNDPMVATALGLRFTDEDIQAQETYVYRIISMTPKNLYEVDTGYIMVAASDIEIIPKPPELSAIGLENAVELQWDARLHLEQFTGYYIEKGNRRGRNWERLNDMPLILTTPEEAYQEAYLYAYTDSLNENYKTASYRIRGVTPFGELSEPSNVIFAYGQDRTPPSPAVNINAVNISDQSIAITWEKNQIEEDLEGIYIQKSTSTQGPFVFLNEEPLSVESKEYIDQTNIYTENYYKVVAIDTAGNASPSLVAYAVIIDSIPPAMPVDITGDIDTAGVVTIRWPTGSEPDLMGYRVYFANQKDHEFTNITPIPLQDTIFTDTIVLNTLSEEIFYRIVAVDLRYNHSVPSDILKLKKPDIVPPVMPAFKDITVTDTAVFLTWINSSSNDVVNNRLYRQEKDIEKWELLYETGEGGMNITKFTDSQVETKATYFYSLDAVDDDGLESGKSLPVSARIYDTGERPDIDNFNATYNEESNHVILSWDYQNAADHHYIIYRSFNGSDFTVYKSVDGTENDYADYDLLGSGNYEYAVQAIFNDGGQSLLTEKQIVNVP